MLPISQIHANCEFSGRAGPNAKQTYELLCRKGPLIIYLLHHSFTGRLWSIFKWKCLNSFNLSENKKNSIFWKGVKKGGNSKAVRQPKKERKYNLILPWAGWIPSLPLPHNNLIYPCTTTPLFVCLVTFIGYASFLLSRSHFQFNFKLNSLPLSLILTQRRWRTAGHHLPYDNPSYGVILFP